MFLFKRRGRECKSDDAKLQVEGRSGAPSTSGVFGIQTSSFSEHALKERVVASAPAAVTDKRLPGAERGEQQGTPQGGEAADVDEGPREHLDDEDRYEMIRQEAGKGSFGTVQVARDVITNELVAVKLIPRGSAVTPQVTNEVLIMRRLNHFHTVRLRRVILTQRYLGIVMEYASAGDMYEFVLRTRRGLDEASAKWFFQQMVIALDYMHRCGLVHRDLKLRNMVLQELAGRYLIKLIDYGFSKDLTRQSLAKTRLGTLEYMAPELLAHTPPAGAAGGESSRLGYDGAKVDVWSLGVALYFMLTCGYPYDLTSEKIHAMGRDVAIIKSILEGPTLVPPFASPDCQDLLRRMLDKNPGTRIAMRDVAAHPFFLTGLPEGAERMNDNPALYQPPAGLQSEEEIRELCAQAGKPLGRTLTKDYSGLDSLRIVDDELEHMDLFGEDEDYERGSSQ